MKLLLIKKNKPLLLMDGDILVYRMGFACQALVDGEIEVEPMENAFYLIKKLMLSLKKKLGTDQHKIYLTSDDKSNYRFKIAKTKIYKGNRDTLTNKHAVGRPIHYNKIRDYLINYWNAEVVSGIEADDALSIAQVRSINDKSLSDTIIVSLDKDLDMVPGMHYNFITETLYECKDPGELILTNNNKKLSGRGFKWFYAQMLLGDAADNIPGIKGYGPVKVFKELADLRTERELWGAVSDVYYSKLDMDPSLIEERLYEIADLLWMQRYEGERKSAMLRHLGEQYE